MQLKIDLQYCPNNSGYVKKQLILVQSDRDGTYRMSIDPKHIGVNRDYILDCEHYLCENENSFRILLKEMIETDNLADENTIVIYRGPTIKYIYGHELIDKICDLLRGNFWISPKGSCV